MFNTIVLLKFMSINEFYYMYLFFFTDKPKVEPVAAYENRIECETIRELESIRHISGTLHMESLAIRERILGPHNPEVFRYSEVFS